MAHITTWIAAARPKTLIASLSPVCMSGVLAHSSRGFQWFLFSMIVATALGIQVVTNLANDYFDCLKGADTEERKGPTRVMGAGLVTPIQMKLALSVSVGITLLAGAFLIIQGGLLFAVLLALALALAFLYTAGPLPLAYLGLGDLFVFLFFGPVAVATPYYLLTGTWALTPFLLGIIPGCLSTTLLTINNLRDIEDDRKVDKKTLIVRFGTRFGKGEALTTLVLALALPLLFTSTHTYLWLLSLGMLFPTARLAVRIVVNRDPLVYNILLAQTAQLLFLFTGLFCVLWPL